MWSQLKRAPLFQPLNHPFFPSALMGNQFTPSALLATRRQGQGTQYMVDSEGYGLGESSWVFSKDNMDPQLMKFFLKTHHLKTWGLRHQVSGLAEVSFTCLSVRVNLCFWLYFDIIVVVIPCPVKFSSPLCNCVLSLICICTLAELIWLPSFDVRSIKCCLIKEFSVWPCILNPPESFHSLKYNSYTVVFVQTDSKWMNPPGCHSATCQFWSRSPPKI